MSVLIDHFQSTLLIAPTGWGKTTLLLDLMKKGKWVYLSPLRALCDEFFERSKSLGGVYCPKSKKDLCEIDDFRTLVITPELCVDKVLEDKDIIWVLDEFHLFYYWGESFRRALVDLYEVLCHFERKALLLSATIDQSVLNYWKEKSKDKIVINLGNQLMKKKPIRRYKFQKKFWSHIESFRREYSTLIFVKYRQQVLALRELLETKGYKVISCLGGESHLFKDRLKSCPYPDFIIGTSALSHGVNLPKVSVVILSYEINNLDFWVQMVGRAGRRGEDFILYDQDNFRLNKRQKIFRMLRSFILCKKLELYEYFK